MSIDPKASYVAEGLNFLRQAFKNRPNIQAVFTAYLSHAQTLEDSLYKLFDRLNLQTATGATLDGIASIVGASRNGLDDDSFRLFIYAQIAANNGDSTLNTVLLLAKKLFIANAAFIKSPLQAPGGGGQNAFVTLCLDAPQLPSRLWPLAQRLLEQNLGSGVQLANIAQSASKAPFAFAGNLTGLGGWGSTADATVGGPMASLITSSAS